MSEIDDGGAALSRPGYAGMSLWKFLIGLTNRREGGGR